MPYQFVDGCPAVLQPAEGHPLRRRVERAERILTVHEYETQRSSLVSLFERSGDDVFVAQYLQFERPDRSARSVAAWAPGVTNGLLPVADAIPFGDPVDGSKF